jgi:DHA2 family multidrug resistance protein
MAGPVLGPILGGVITDLASWRWIFVLNVPLGGHGCLGIGTGSGKHGAIKPRIDGAGLLLMVVGVGSLQLALERSIGQTWPFSAEVITEATVAVLALAGIAIRSGRSQFTLFKFQVFRNVNFAASVL